MNKFCLTLFLSLSFATDLCADDAPKNDGFVPLFNGVDLKGWVGNTDGYKAADGVLVCQTGKSKGGKIYTAKEYADFIFQFDFKLTPGANNGVGIRAPLTGNPSKTLSRFKSSITAQRDTPRSSPPNFMDRFTNVPRPNAVILNRWGNGIDRRFVLRKI